MDVNLVLALYILFHKCYYEFRSNGEFRLGEYILFYSCTSCFTKKTLSAGDVGFKTKTGFTFVWVCITRWQGVR